MKIILFTGILLGGLAITGFMQPDSASDYQYVQPLTNLKWGKRVVLVFMPEENHPLGARQIQLFKQEPKELKERDLLLIPVSGARVEYQATKPGDGERLRKNFKVPENDFTLILIGKDGGEKYRTSKVVEPAEIFRIIDAMPMRQSEINRQKNSKK